jgi:transposase InsO family protein
MRSNTNDRTLEINYQKRFKFLMREYELVKQKKHSRFRFVSDFYRFHGTNRQTFLKYYNRFHLSHSDTDLLPRKRGPRWKSRRPIPFIENKVIEERRKGLNRYEIANNLRPKLKQFTPSPSGVYNITRRFDLNRLDKRMKEEKRDIIKEKAGEMAHIDCHYLAQDIVADHRERLYLVTLLDDYSRLAWTEVVPDITNLTVTFATLRLFSYFRSNHDIEFKELLSDNGKEFGGKNLKEKRGNPFERMLMEMGITHRYTRPYRPQTNGKVERFWKTIENELLEDTVFDSIEHLETELSEYLYYYSYQRIHQGIGGIAPVQKLSAN